MLTEKKQHTHINRNHKDLLFKFIFGSAEHKEWALSLFNAINQTDYTNSDDIEFNMVEDVLYLGMRNDVSFILYMVMMLCEHQSTFNPNEPIRFLHHISQLYAKYEKKYDYYLYGTKLNRYPKVICVVFYNGNKDQPERQILKLSDATGDDHLELKVLMININYGKNKELMEACQPLKEYAWTINEIRNNHDKGMEIDKAVDQMLKDMPKEFIIRSYLIGHQAEVKDMFGSEYTMDEIIYHEKKQSHEEGLDEGLKQGREDGLKQGREEGLDEGLKQGKSEGIKEIVMEMLKNGMAIDQIAKFTKLPKDTIRSFDEELDLTNTL